MSDDTKAKLFLGLMGLWGVGLTGLGLWVAFHYLVWLGKLTGLVG